MPSTLRFFDENWEEFLNVEIESSTRSRGVYFDGIHFWVLIDDDPTFEIRQYGLGGVRGSETLDLISTITLTLETIVNNCSGMTSDGWHFYVSNTRTITRQMSATIARRITRFSIEGERLNNRATSSELNTNKNSDTNDIAYDGLMFYYRHKATGLFNPLGGGDSNDDFRWMANNPAMHVIRNFGPQDDHPSIYCLAHDGIKLLTGKQQGGSTRVGALDITGSPDLHEAQSFTNSSMTLDGFDLDNHDNDFTEFFYLGAHQHGDKLVAVREA